MKTEITHLRRRRCPRCGEKDGLVFDEIPDGYGTVVTCGRCDWVGWERELLVDAEPSSSSWSGGAKEKP